jgi:hypothetical protein
MKKLEDNLLYRLIKVLNIIALLACFLITLVVGWTFKPQTLADVSSSYIACNNGRRFSLRELNIYMLSSNKDSLTTNQDLTAKKNCMLENGRYLGNMYDTEYFPKSAVPVTKNYQLIIVNRVTGSWMNALLTWFIGIIGSYFVLNIIRETTNYVLFGKPFDWLWIRKPTGKNE